jgi:hypothetical protein
MKNLTKSIAIIALACSSIGFAQAANEFVATNNTTDTEICVAAAEGNRLKLLKTLKDASLSKNYVVENVQCNELSFVDFVEQYSKESTKINKFITNGKYMNNLVLASVTAR